MKQGWAALTRGAKRIDWSATGQRMKAAGKRPESGDNRQGDASSGGVLLGNPLKSVGMKLFIVFFVSIVTFVAVVGGISYIKSRDVLKSKVSEASLEAIVQAGQKLDFLYNSLENLSLQIMLDKDLQGQLNDLNRITKGSYEYLELTRKLGDKLNVYLYADKNIKAIHLLRPNGEYINVSGASMTGDNFGDKDWFKRITDASGKAVWLESQQKGYSQTMSSPGFAIGRSLRDTTSNNINAVLVMEVATDVLGKQVDGISFGDGSSIRVLTANNMNVYTSKAEDIAKKSAIELSKDSLAEDSGSVTTNGQQVVFYKSPVSSWYLVGAMPVASLTSSATVIAQMTIIMALVATVVAIVIGYFVAGMIRRPINRLRDLMDQGARGNLQVRADFTRKDEIGQLGNSFDVMMEQITSLVLTTQQSAAQVMETAAELTNASRTTATSAKEIAVATEEISVGASGLANESERGNELTQQIGERMKNVIQANLEMGSSASDVQSSSELGTKYMSELIQKTNDAETTIRAMVEKVDKLKESTRSIRKILDVLNNVSKQTNILSLNATIEAARAGAAGKGFMVVADEIRKLADQSRQSIGVVGEITETIQREIDETVTVLSNAYPIFQQQITSVKEADTIFARVREHMGGFILQLSNVSDSISELDQSQIILSEAMSNVSAVAQQSLATSEQVSSLSQEQLNISEGLVRLVERLENLSNSLKDSLTRFRI
ncbi:chemotaxis protein [Gordoniibacillus kamchatkensis]|uniref:Chemotaxis protein n=2 Tax=Gordoniibacillus kamchatkensis TaxID=1590651 RepID=A0ABR5AJ79_9BACL|nr:chemotaxis protein [Paenibacillus sp. VKM B-2647]